MSDKRAFGGIRGLHLLVMLGAAVNGWVFAWDTGARLHVNACSSMFVRAQGTTTRMRNTGSVSCCSCCAFLQLTYL